jgi:hypothetical protein
MWVMSKRRCIRQEASEDMCNQRERETEGRLLQAQQHGEGKQRGEREERPLKQKKTAAKAGG